MQYPWFHNIAYCFVECQEWCNRDNNYNNGTGHISIYFFFIRKSHFVIRISYVSTTHEGSGNLFSFFFCKPADNLGINIFFRFVWPRVVIGQGDTVHVLAVWLVDFYMHDLAPQAIKIPTCYDVTSIADRKYYGWLPTSNINDLHIVLFMQGLYIHTYFCMEFHSTQILTTPTSWFWLTLDDFL